VTTSQTRKSSEPRSQTTTLQILPSRNLAKRWRRIETNSRKNSLQPLRNTNPVVRITRTMKGLEHMKNPSKNRDKQMKAIKPMNTDTTTPKEV